MSTSQALERGREAYGRRRWSEALTELRAAEAESPLAAADYERLATADFLLGGDAGGAETWERAHHVLLARGELEGAVRCTFWLGMNLIDRGEMARGAGWLATGRRLLEEANLECAATGYMLVPQAIQAAAAGDTQQAIDIGEKVIELGRRFNDQDLVTMVRHGQGRTLLEAGRLAEGLTLLDEVMVSITSTAVSPMVVGIVYCSVVDALHNIYDTARAQAWTAALLRWCEDQPELVMYRGRCMVHHAAVLRMRGDWTGALEHSEQARERFLGPPAHRAAGAAFYEEAELHRLRGDYAKAQVAYRRAGEFGHSGQPGLALLSLATGRLDAAEAAIRRVSSETVDRGARAAILPALVEILLAAGDVGAAREGAEELVGIAGDLQSDYLRAAAAASAGAVQLADGAAAEALKELRRALALWQALAAPYEAARVRMAIGLACRDLGDDDAALAELAAAAEVFARLQAAPDVARLEALTAKPAEPAPLASAGLTGREAQLLALLATGKTNRQMATELFISEKTVARHVSNIFNKLGVSSRAAATAYAFRHDLA